MAKVKISEYSATPSANTDVDNIDINEGCSPSGINNAIRAVMSHLKNFQTGASGDSVTVGGNLSVTGTTALSGAATAPTASSSDNSTNIATTAFVTTKLGTLGTMSTQNAGSVAITGGSIAGTSLSGTVTSISTLVTAGEKTTVSATAATGTIQYDMLTQSILYYTTNASGNWTLNLRGNSTTTLNSVMAVGETRVITFLSTQGTTAFYQTGLTIDGTSVTPKWQNGIAPTFGNASGIDSYVIAIVKTANATFTALESSTRFA